MAMDIDISQLRAVESPDLEAVHIATTWNTEFKVTQLLWI